MIILQTKCILFLCLDTNLFKKVIFTKHDILIGYLNGVFLRYRPCASTIVKHMVTRQSVKMVCFFNGANLMVNS